MTRRISVTGINRFQSIYRLLREYKERTGNEPLNLSLGNPDLVPNEDILALQARFAADPRLEFHTYAEDMDLHGFTEGMVELHGWIRYPDHNHLAALPIPGIKTASAQIAIACGLYLPDHNRRRAFRVVSNLPAYDVIGTWTASYLGCERIVWPLTIENNMCLDIDQLEAALDRVGADRADLIFVIRPGNPSPVGATKEEWQRLIEHCIPRGTRLVNDAAYSGLAGENHIPLAAVAVDYPELEWVEMYSVSKSFSDPGARLGALVGSKDFVEDFRMIKGNTDSGTVPYVMAAYGAYFEDRNRARAVLVDMRLMYEGRVRYLVNQLEKSGMQSACPTGAGFFTLWKTPRCVLGIPLTDLETNPHMAGLSLSDIFNRTVLFETGIVGVHFESPAVDGSRTPLIRYAVCTDVLDSAFQARFEQQLARLQPGY